METLTVKFIKLAIVAATGFSKDALHIYVGLAVFFSTAVVLRKPLRSIVSLVCGCVIAIAGEVLDMRNDVASLGYWR